MKKKYNKTAAYRLGILFSTLIFSLFLIQAVLIKGAKKNDQSRVGKVNLIMSHNIDPEIMVFGSSVSEVGIQSNLLSSLSGKSVYNASIDGTRFKQSECLIDEFLTYSKNCKTIILGTSFFSLSNYKPLLTEPSRFLAHLDNKYVFKTFQKYKFDNLYLNKYCPGYLLTNTDHTFYKASAIGWLNIIRGKELSANALNGWLPHYEDWQIKTEFKNAKPRKIRITKETTVILKRVVNKITSRGIKVILVRLPVYESFNKLIINNRQISKGLCSTYTDNYLMIDFSNSYIHKDSSFFYNHGHVNYKGAEKITKIIGENLNKKGYINTP